MRKFVKKTLKNSLRPIQIKYIMILSTYPGLHFEGSVYPVDWIGLKLLNMDIV